MSNNYDSSLLAFATNSPPVKTSKAKQAPHCSTSESLRRCVNEAKAAVDEFETHRFSPSESKNIEERVKYMLAAIHMDAVLTDLIDRCEAFLKEYTQGQKKEDRNV